MPAINTRVVSRPSEPLNVGEMIMRARPHQRVETTGSILPQEAIFLVRLTAMVKLNAGEAPTMAY